VTDPTDSPLENFLAHEPVAPEEEEPVDVPTQRPRRPTWRRRLRHFLFEKEPSGYSALAPRDAQGRRAKIFFFNGSGRGR